MTQQPTNPTIRRPLSSAAAGGADPAHRAGLAARTLTIAGAALVLVGGYVHYCLYRNGYRYIPKIGVSFLLDTGASLLLGIGLVIISFGVGGRAGVGEARHGAAAVVTQLMRVSAILVSVGALGAVAVAHTSSGLFNFHEMGLQPAPQTLIAIGAETLAAIMLTLGIAEQAIAIRRRTLVVADVTDPALKHTEKNAA